MIATMCVAREDIRTKWPLYDLKLQPLPPWKLPMIKWLNDGSQEGLTGTLLFLF